MIEDKLKQLAKIPDLELMKELEEMFSIAWEDRYAVPVGDADVIGKHLNQVLLSLGNTGGIYVRFLDKVEQLTLVAIPEKDKLQYLYDLNYSVGRMLRHLIDLTLFSKLNNQDIHNGFTNLCNKYQVEYFITEEQPIQTVTKFARFVNIQQQVYNNPDVNLRPIVQYQAHKEFDLPADEPFLVAGKIVNQSFLGVYHRHVFNIMLCAYELHRSTELDEIKKDNQVFSDKVLQLWVNVFALLDVMGYDWNSIQRVYKVAHETSKWIDNIIPTKDENKGS